MKIYMGKRTIPELAGLPASVGRKNYNDARYLARSHPQYWAGLTVALVVMVGISLLINRLHNDESSLLFSLIRAGCSLLPAFFIAEQFSIAVMRKHYSHILSRRPEGEGETAHLIEEADANERHQWRYLRWVSQPLLLLVMLIILYAVSNFR